MPQDNFILQKVILVNKLYQSPQSYKYLLIIFWQVATYDFSFPVHINSFKASDLYCEYLSQKKVLMPRVSPIIPPCFVQATGM